MYLPKLKNYKHTNLDGFVQAKNQTLNWKKITENWKLFTEVNTLTVEKNDRNYFYGKQTIYQAKENFNDFEIFYEYKINKSADYGSSFNLGHKMMIVVPIELTQNVGFRMSKNSLWNRLIKQENKLKIISHGIKTKDLLPMVEIEKLMKSLTDLKISIESFNRHQNPNVNFGKKVVLLESKFHPKELEEFELSRTITIKFLKELKNRKIIKASTQNRL